MIKKTIIILFLLLLPHIISASVISTQPSDGSTEFPVGINDVIIAFDSPVSTESLTISFDPVIEGNLTYEKWINAFALFLSQRSCVYFWYICTY